jgi:hypothetical protein
VAGQFVLPAVEKLENPLHLVANHAWAVVAHERSASGAPDSRSEARAEAIGRRLQALVRGFGGCAATHVEGTGAAPGALCYPALETVGRRDRPRIGALCPLVRLVSGVGDHITGDRPCPDPVWETANISVTPAPTAVLDAVPYFRRLYDTPQRLFS